MDPGHCCLDRSGDLQIRVGLDRRVDATLHADLRRTEIPGVRAHLGHVYEAEAATVLVLDAEAIGGEVAVRDDADGLADREAADRVGRRDEVVEFGTAER